MTDTPAVAPARTAGAPAVGDDWWAPGLALAERCARPAAPVGTGSTRSGTPSTGGPSGARQRLAAWYDAYGLGDSGMFTIRLADCQLTEEDLLDLLAESPAGLAARSTPPGWADLTTRVLAAASTPPGVRPIAGDGPPADWITGFTRILAPYLDLTDRLLAGELPVDRRVDVCAIRAEFRDNLAGRLVRAASRTLVVELNVRREQGRLVGATGEERFGDFVDQLRRPAELAGLLARYPVLARVLAQTCRYALDATVELVRRLTADRAAIVDTFFGGTDPGPVTGLHIGAGDRHQRGRAVALPRFASGVRVAYKPRPLAVHRHFNGMLDWLNAHRPDLGLRTLTVLDRGGYGWVEYVTAAPCADRAAVERFYHRQGALLALLYALDGSDIHYENLIAAGDQPVLVDVETLFHPALAVPAGIGTDPAAEALTGSVYRSALLPQLLLGDDDALDISGLGGDKGRPMPVPAVDWADPGTDRMRLVRRTTVFGGADNRPRLDGVDVDPADFTGFLLAGFRAGYDSIVTHRAELLDPDGPVRRFAADATRVVVRATRVYLRLLDESTHPEVLRDALDRDRLFDVLWAGSAGDPTRLRLVRYESTELWHGDVPVFTARPGSRDLWSGSGDRIVDALDRPPLDGVLAKIGRMGDVDRYDQEWIIRATLATRHRHDGHETGTPVPRPFAATPPDPARLLAAARGVADQIIARGYDDGTRINWLGLELLDERQWTVMPLGAGLANGYPGVAVFFAQLAALTGDPRYATAARRSLAPVPRLVEQLAADPDLAAAVGCGGFAGFGGLAYALTQVSVLLTDPRIGQWIDPVVRLAAGTVDTDAGHGVFDGWAGCLAAMLAVHTSTGLPTAWHTATRCAEHLLASPRGRPQAPGFAFGQAGVGWALLRYATATGQQRYADRGLDLLRDAADLARLRGHSWCQGWPGVGLALLDGAGSTTDLWTATLIDRTVDAVLPSGPLPNHSLCHGELGRLELLGAAAQRERAAATAHIRHASMMLSAIELSGARCGTPAGAPSPGLLNGMSGVGHGLLRLAFPDQIPSVLLLQPPETSPPAAGSRRRLPMEES
ncbi:type 2 lanthipeptide synthetase LanM family protein [Micromonospora echinofusca]|uniref:Type 2 lantipeptide synthetase LanM n=1 Tax=Micromonospora echinofusca TaxID=47858 RepID=A0ABS3VNB0_MICEH|nr:type 2 lanthipeptide synthetase LanM family protein [Micromonospora echinofusca]MBO4205976.1 type 2 lantipeptide synthetase LanM [Micromonospora echinofusca]